MRNANKKLSAGFTLIELIVVIFIITILLAIIVPNVRNTREKARGTHCRNNLRQFIIACNQFFEDQGGEFTTGGGAGGFSKDGSSVYTLSEDGVTFRKEDIDYFSTQDYRDDIVQYGGSMGITNVLAMYSIVNGYIGGNRNSPESSVAFCPHTYNTLDVFNTNSPNFKGFHDDPIWGKTSDWGGSSYGLNSDQMGGNVKRENIRGDKIAFSDWNHREGWGCSVFHSTAVWEFTNPKYGATQGSSKGNLGCLTEVGFYHTGTGEGLGANAVFFDGRVEWIGQYAITNENLWR